MSRVTPPVQKINHIVRSISSSTSRSVHKVDTSRQASIHLPRKLSDLRSECNKRQLKADGTRVELVNRLTSHDFHTISPVRPTSQTTRPIPLMQGFRTSSPLTTAPTTSTIDAFILPSLPTEPPTNPFSRLRVPLLPDNYSPDRSATSMHKAEELDTPVPAAEILIVASHPEDVVPAALSEVVGNEGVDIDIEQLTAGFQGVGGEAEEKKEMGMFGELWSGLMDDVFGPKKASKLAV